MLKFYPIHPPMLENKYTNWLLEQRDIIDDLMDS